MFAGVLEVEERKAQKSYWEEHSKDLTVEAMMLDSRAADLDKEERPEVTESIHEPIHACPPDQPAEISRDYYYFFANSSCMISFVAAKILSGLSSYVVMLLY